LRLLAALDALDRRLFHRLTREERQRVDAGLTRLSNAANRSVLWIALAALIAGATVPSHLFSPPVRQVVEYVEYILMALVIPFSAWAIGLLHYIRYH